MLFLGSITEFANEVTTKRRKEAGKDVDERAEGRTQFDKCETTED